VSASPLIQLAGLGKAYRCGGRQVEVLRDLHFEVKAGERIAITGASGSGKSTLLNILACLDHCSAGSYHFAGRDMSGLDDAALSGFRNAEVGFVFQGFNLLPQFTVLENVELPFLYARLRPLEIRARCASALDQVGLSHRLAHRPDQLSGGEMQRAAIARAIVLSPRLILADEPTGNLDARSGAVVMDVLAELHRGGATVLTVTHDARVAALADRSLELRDGALVQ
jgi:putative ABC transport system ATP-binding protein